MNLADHAVRLAELHESPGFSATRFDRGPVFAGRVAVLPSAYNPPTRAHLGLLELARTVEDVSVVAAMLTTNNVDKSLFGAPLSHRVGMLLALHEDSPQLAVVVFVNHRDRRSIRLRGVVDDCRSNQRRLGSDITNGVDPAYPSGRSVPHLGP